MDISNLCELVHLFYEYSESCSNADVDQTLDVLYRLFVSQVQTKLVLYLNNEPELLTVVNVMCACV